MLKKVILCPNPYRDHELTVAKEAKRILDSVHCPNVVCVPFRNEEKPEGYGLDIRPLQQELRGADMIIAFGGDGTILHLSKTAAHRDIPVLGVNLGYVTLHVGLGTFRPVKEDDIEQHDMHSEYCVIPPETATLINETKARGGRVICVGTTSCRTLESWAQEDGHMEPSAGWTSIYIYPGYRFKVMDALVTNFHLPQSTLIMLVSALAGCEHVLHAYEEAVKERYRFFSFGDAMFVS